MARSSITTQEMIIDAQYIKKKQFVHCSVQSILNRKAL